MQRLIIATSLWLMLYAPLSAHGASADCFGYEPAVEEIEAVLAAALEGVGGQPYYPEIEQACLFPADGNARIRYSVVWPPQRQVETYSRLVRVCETAIDDPSSSTEATCRPPTQEASLGAGRWFPIEAQIGPLQLQEIVALVKPEMRQGEELGAIEFVAAPGANWSIERHGYEVTLRRAGIASRRLLRLRYVCAGEVDCRWHLARR
ncbi:MAG: hypothetical protein AAF513_09055 [Pseudomonadota bacterium]